MYLFRGFRQKRDHVLNYPNSLCTIGAADVLHTGHDVLQSRNQNRPGLISSKEEKNSQMFAEIREVKSEIIS